MADTRERLTSVGREHSVHVATYSPGDGVTRYRFVDARGAQPADLDYFGARSSRVMGTELGLKDAWVWMRGYLAGLSTEERLGFITRMEAYEAAHA